MNTKADRMFRSGVALCLVLAGTAGASVVEEALPASSATEVARPVPPGAPVATATPQASAASEAAGTPRQRRKLRFVGGPVCNCASGLGEKDIEAAASRRPVAVSPAPVAPAATAPAASAPATPTASPQ